MTNDGRVSEMTYQLDTPMSEANDATQELLVELAEQHEQRHDRPCCDAETTLRDWLDSGLWVSDDGSVMVAYALLLVMPVVFVAALVGLLLGAVTP